MSFKSLRFNCFAGGTSYYDYGGGIKVGNDRKVPCPLCGKTVKLRAHQSGFPRFIPEHHRAHQETSDADSLSAAIAKATGNEHG